MRTLSAIAVVTAHVAALAAAQGTTVSTTYNTDIASYNFDDSAFNYCQANYPSSSSYNSVANATLEFIQMVVRHGDRTPVLVVPGQDVTWNCNNYSENIYLKSSTTSSVSSSALVNQKVEIPAFNGKYGYSNQLWKGTCNVGQLTDTGKSQHETLGSQLRSIYVDKLGFLPYWLNNTNQVYVRTTDFWRTKNSAESLLGGLWPYRGITAEMAVPMYTYPAEIETMDANNDACPATESTWIKIISDSNYQKFFQGQSALMSKLAGILNVSGSTWTMVWDGYADTLFTRKCHNKGFPCNSAGTVCANADDENQVKRNANFDWAYKYRDHPLAKTYTRLHIGSFIGTLRDQLQNVVAGKTGSVKLALYSGHDTTIGPILGSLKAGNRQMLWPPYASNLIFELWKKKDGSRVVRVLFNGEVLQLQQGNQWCDLSACPLDTFTSYLGDYIPSDIAAECN
ncbi:hypothetical protein LPJ57_006548 [Coemansia sp. RSA 486]|nr:hypothetical protein LPJ57_006548 [Coemansia sp. RSA 486]KAJ2227697.1 hypothetical protein IWW45_006920 [Coemansia sp. RSA 485]KAJ2603067.1 hypothetical protein GGF39_000386 [Coemansia sp. RSA 1721]KAJ2640413.1 hypothetical protein GGF40_000061 [Coemansia sp. RSA 1286]